jgi:hypothetical protein
MSEPQSSNMENLEAILKGFDGAMAVTLSPLIDNKRKSTGSDAGRGSYSLYYYI